MTLRRLTYFFCLFLVCFASTTHAFIPFGNSNQSASLAPMLKKTMPSVVAISGLKRVKTPILPPGHPSANPMSLPEEQILEQIGSGIIVDAERGYILTNAHVVAELDEIRVLLSDKRRYEAHLLGQDQASDLALLQIPANKLTEIAFADSVDLQVGDFVVAIGNPYGFNHTVTSGIVSALSRNDIGFDGYYDFIQTDAPINVGNSGGALLNLKGELVGINTAIISPPNHGANVGLGLAIPSTMARGILTQLAEQGQVNRGPLGVSAQSLTPELAEGFKIPERQGAVIIDIIPDTPADKTGLQVGDVIVKLDGKPVKDSTHLRTQISLIPTGSKAKIYYYRSGKPMISTVIIENPRDSLTKGEKIFSGLTGCDLDETPSDFPLEGIRIVSMDKEAPLAMTELRPGDIIVAANQQTTPTMSRLKLAMSKTDKVAILQVTRDKITFFVAVKTQS